MTRAWTWTKPSLMQFVILMFCALLLAASVFYGTFSFRAVTRGVAVGIASLSFAFSTQGGNRSALLALAALFFVLVAAVLQGFGW